MFILIRFDLVTTCSALKIRINDEKSMIDDSERGLLDTSETLETPVKVINKNNEKTEEYIPRKNLYYQ